MKGNSKATSETQQGGGEVDASTNSVLWCSGVVGVILGNDGDVDARLGGMGD